MAQLKFSIPLPLWDRNQGRLAEIQAAHERAVADIAARQLAIGTEIREAQTRALGYASVLAELRGRAATQARENTALIEQSVASGMSSFLIIFESRRQSLEIDLVTLETESQLVTAITDWQTRTGRITGIFKAATVPTSVK